MFRSGGLRGVGLVAVLFALGACGGGKHASVLGGTTTAPAQPGEGSSTTAASGSTSSTVAPGSTGSTGSSTGGPATTQPAELSDASLPNGTSYGYVTSVDPAASTVTVDIVQVLDRHSAEARTVCPEIATGGIDGYCIKNASPKLRTLPANGAAVRLLAANGSAELHASTLAGLNAHLHPDPEANFYKLSINRGAVRELVELFRP
jgi:hypothetical protein